MRINPAVEKKYVRGWINRVVDRVGRVVSITDAKTRVTQRYTFPPEVELPRSYCMIKSRIHSLTLDAESGKVLGLFCAHDVTEEDRERERKVGLVSSAMRKGQTKLG